MQSTSAIEWVVFDLGGVVLTQTTALPRLASELGLPSGDPQVMDRFTRAYQAPRLEYDRTSDAAAYWATVATECGVAVPDDATVARITKIDNEGWSNTNPETVRLIGDLDDAGVKLAILSNMPSSMGELVRAASWARPFRHFVISGDLNLVKPDPAIYRSLLTTLGATPDTVIFLDDLARNIDAAVGAGIHGVRFTDPAEAREALLRLGIKV